MIPDDLKQALLDAPNRAEWVEQVATWFAGHELYYGHGTDNAGDEAYWLVWQLSGHPDDLGALGSDAAIAGRVVDLARRRVEERIPMAYLLGTAWFAGLEFAVSPDVLIPRSPLAELVERHFLPWRALEPGDRVLEVGTGSGCIAIAAAIHNPGVTVDATENDRAALAVARANVRRHRVGDRVHLLEADLFPREGSGYRVIMSNPPYVPTAAVAGLPPEYRHEPVQAFDGGSDGLGPVRRLLAGAGERLTDDGVLIVEVGLSAEALESAYPRVPWTWLEFERGGEGVFVLTAAELKDGWR